MIGSSLQQVGLNVVKYATATEKAHSATTQPPGSCHPFLAYCLAHAHQGARYCCMLSKP
jgi:hypothetical protein